MRGSASAAAHGRRPHRGPVAASARAVRPGRPAGPGQRHVDLPGRVAVLRVRAGDAGGRQAQVAPSRWRTPAAIAAATSRVRPAPCRPAASASHAEQLGLQLGGVGDHAAAERRRRRPARRSARPRAAAGQRLGDRERLAAGQQQLVHLAAASASPGVTVVRSARRARFEHGALAGAAQPHGARRT